MTGLNTFYEAITRTCNLTLGYNPCRLTEVTRPFTEHREEIQCSCSGLTDAKCAMTHCRQKWNIIWFPRGREAVKMY